MKLPEKQVLIKWHHEPTVIRLMHDNRWSREMAELWFTDFMKWLYTSVRYREKYHESFAMDGLHYLDDVWHAYILHTKDYFAMSKQLFDVDYIHHSPANPYNIDGVIGEDIFRQQMMELLDDWGEEYIDRVWKYGADVSDMTSEPQPVYAV